MHTHSLSYQLQSLSYSLVMFWLHVLHEDQKMMIQSDPVPAHELQVKVRELVILTLINVHTHTHTRT